MAFAVVSKSQNLGAQRRSHPASALKQRSPTARPRRSVAASGAEYEHCARVRGIRALHVLVAV